MISPFKKHFFVYSTWQYSYKPSISEEVGDCVP